MRTIDNVARNSVDTLPVFAYFKGSMNFSCQTICCPCDCCMCRETSISGLRLQRT